MNRRTFIASLVVLPAALRTLVSVKSVVPAKIVPASVPPLTWISSPRGHGSAFAAFQDQLLREIAARHAIPPEMFNWEPPTFAANTPHIMRQEPSSSQPPALSAGH